MSYRLMEEISDMVKEDNTKVRSLDQQTIADAADYLACFETFAKEVDGLYSFLKRENPAMKLMIELRKNKQKLLNSLDSNYYRKYGHPYIKLYKEEK